MSRIRNLIGRIAAGVALAILIIAPPVLLIALIGRPFPSWSTLTNEISNGSISTETTMRTAAALFVVIWVWAMFTIAAEALSILQSRSTTRQRQGRSTTRTPVTTRDTAGPTGPLVRLVRIALLGTVTTATTFTSLTASAAAPVQHVDTYITAPIEADTAGEPVQAAAAVDSIVADGRQTPLSIAMDLGDETLRNEIIALNPDWKGGPFDQGTTVIVPLVTQPPAAQALPTAMAAPSYTVRPNDGWINVVEGLWGPDSGERWQELSPQLVGQEVAPGVVLTPEMDTIHPNWVFHHPAAPATALSAPSYTVRPNDGWINVVEGLWGPDSGERWQELAAQLVGQEVAPGVVLTAEMGMIHPNWVFTHPDNVQPPIDQTVTEPAPVIETPAPVEPAPAPVIEAPAPLPPPTAVEPPAANTATDVDTVDDEIDSDATPVSTPAPANVDPSTLPVAAATTSDSSIPFGGLVGGVSVAAVIIGLLEAARRRRQRTAPAGAPTGTVHNDNAQAELALRSLASRSHHQLVTAVTVLLSQHYRDATLPATVLVQSIVVTDDGNITVNFDETIAPPAPFTGSDQHWTITAEQLDDIDTDIDPEDQLLKTVVSIGRNAASEIFVDLESVGSVTITGDTDSIDGLCRAIRTQLDDNVEIFTNATGLDIDDRHDTQPVDDTNLANIGIDRAPLWDAIAAGEIDSIIGARLGDWPYEQLVAACVIDPTGDVDATFLSNTFGGRGVATITATPGGATTWHFDTDGHLSIHDKPAATNTEQAPADEPFIDIATPAVLDATTAAAVDELTGAEPTPALVSIKPTEASEPSAYEPPPWTYCVRVMRRDLDVVDTNGDVVTFVKGNNRNGKRAPELLAFLHQQPNNEASLDEIRNALWHDVVFADDPKRPPASDDTISTLCYKTRTPIGKDLAVTHSGGKWKLNAEHVTTDATLLRHRADHAKDNPAEWPRVAELLKSITGVPFMGSRSFEWAQAFAHFPKVCGDIRTAASIAATAALDADCYDEAMWICDQALLANPCDEMLAQIAYDIDGARGDFEAIRQRHTTLIYALRAGDSEEPHPSTVERYNQWMSQRRTA